jgi:DNA mismatch repair protein MSH4
MCWNVCARGWVLSGSYPNTPEAGELPDISTEKSLIKKKWMFKTKELSALNDRINESLTDIYQFTNAEVQGIFRVCREEVSGLYKAAEAVSMLDLLLSFASTCRLTGDKEYTRPKIGGVGSTPQGTLAIKNGRHPVRKRHFLSHLYIKCIILPRQARDKHRENSKQVPFSQILEAISSSGTVVPNNTFHNDAQNVALISGPNMSGKSTYIKQVALCVVLAHIGAYVPAEFFSSPPIDRIFTRCDVCSLTPDRKLDSAYRMQRIYFLCIAL